MDKQGHLKKNMIQALNLKNLKVAAHPRLSEMYVDGEAGILICFHVFGFFPELKS